MIQFRDLSRAAIANFTDSRWSMTSSITYLNVDLLRHSDALP